MNSVNLEMFSPVYFPTKDPLHFDEKINLFSKKIKQISYSTCEHFWSYGGKICLITRHFLNTLVNNAHVVSLAGKNFTKAVGHITIRLKVFSIVSVFFNVFDFKTTAQKIINDIFSKNLEGASLNAISFTIITADILDSLATFVNATITLASATPIAVIAAMGMPLTAIISSFGTISRTIQIAKSHHLYKKIDQEISSERYLDKDSLKVFLEKTLGINQELKDLLAVPIDQLTNKQLEQIARLKEQNKAAILRAAPKEAVKELEQLLAMLDNKEIFSEKQQEKVFNILKTVQKHLIKKIEINTLGIIANLLTLTALTLFTVTSLASFPFALITIGFAIRLAALFYQDQQVIQAANFTTRLQAH